MSPRKIVRSASKKAEPKTEAPARKVTRTVKRTRAVATPKSHLPKRTLVAIDDAPEGFPKIASGVLEGTYFRLSDGELECMVTVMPDGLEAAWSSCAKCHDTFTRCRCKGGVYHPSSIGYIRAKHEQEDKSTPLIDYSKFFDPWGRLKGNRKLIWEESPIYSRMGSDTPARKREQDKPVARKRRIVRTKSRLTVAQIENMSAETMQAEAEKQARKAVSKTRTVIRGRKKGG